MEKEMRNCSTRASSPKLPIIFPNTAEQENLTKPERLVSNNLKHLYFAAGLLALANQAAEEFESLPVKRIEENAYEQGKRAKRISTIQVVEEARGLELDKNVKKRDNESGLGVGKRFVGNSLSETLKTLSFDDLLVLTNTASAAFRREVSRGNGFEEVVVVEAEEYMEEHDTCKQREDGDADRGGSYFGLSEELGRNLELMQQRGLAGPMNVVEVAKPDRDRSDICREDRLFEKKYVRKKRLNHNKEQHLESKSVGVIAGSSDLIKKSCINKSTSLINVDDAQREEEGLHNNGDSHSKSEQVEAVEGQGGCSGMNNKTNSETQSRDENQKITNKSIPIPLIVGIKIPKRKRSQRKRKPEEPTKNSGSRQGENEQACDQNDSDAESEEDNEEEEEEEKTISEADLECDEEMTEEEDVSDASSCNWWSFTKRSRTCKGIRNLQWRNKKKRNCKTLEETLSNRKILLLAVEAITHQLGLLDISMKPGRRRIALKVYTSFASLLTSL